MDPKLAIAELARMPEELKQRLTDLDEAELHFKPNADTFSVLENVCHLRDIEVEGYARRLGLLLREDNPRLPDLDGAALARERSYNEQPLKPALDAFLSMRRRCLATLADLTAEEFARRGQFENVGQVTLEGLVELWVEHDREHLKELDGLLPLLHGVRAAHGAKPSQSLLNR